MRALKVVFLASNPCFLALSNPDIYLMFDMLLRIAASQKHGEDHFSTSMRTTIMACSFSALHLALPLLPKLVWLLPLFLQLFVVLRLSAVLKSIGLASEMACSEQCRFRGADQFKTLQTVASGWGFRPHCASRNDRKWVKGILLHAEPLMRTRHSLHLHVGKNVPERASE